MKKSRAALAAIRLDVHVLEDRRARGTGRHGHGLDVSLPHVGHELAEGDLPRVVARLHELVDRDHHHDQEQPEQQRLVALLHVNL
jgi:hypothetical protein